MVGFGLYGLTSMGNVESNTCTLPSRRGRKPAKVQVDDAELRVTEMALRVLLDAIQSPILPPPSGRVHECSVCRKRDVWGPDWTWFGSWREEEKSLLTCSRPCWEHICRLEIANG
jgi:hypothetical protein